MCRRLWISFLLSALCVPAFARTIVVDANGGGGFAEIQPAIDNAVDGGRVLVACES